MKKEKKKESIETLKKQSSFLAYMSHEIRTPLNVIMGVTDILSEGTFDPKEQTKLVNLLKTAEEHLMTIINNILDFSKLESGAVEMEKDEFALGELIEKLYSLLYTKAASKGIYFSYEIASDLPSSLIGDPNKLRQILLNLVGNSIKFTHTGYVKIRVSKIENEGQNTQNDEITVLFEIIDTGIGIAPNKLDKLFHDYVQVDASIASKYGGTGLGLAISKKIINLMGGDIMVESELEKGSRFYFTLRLKAGNNEYPSKNITSSTKTNKSISPYNNAKVHNILLVDDAEDNRTIIQLYLQKSPYILDMAENGLMAISKAQKMRYDLILMDVEMPIMDGYMATQKIREWEISNNLPHTPICALSANAFEADIQESLKRGFNLYLTKPVKKTILLEAIEKFIYQLQ